MIIVMGTNNIDFYLVFFFEKKNVKNVRQENNYLKVL